MTTFMKASKGQAPWKKVNEAWEGWLTENALPDAEETSAAEDKD
eukprot:CAMPEP_0204186894 /NCGR_PEP_ID=MMETSP0361-20130328/56357_1 /ASSEMBLY_ACC=CAM_ASM_000343 /TAXON_ID=268821 /ORGANISM="Scrippsiella Hangoei, Strain SHTV-5" /LENGTH=43 /DNA_ID= /DNA_START= /DNA_END= /DNA_ORIENTATION=